MDGLAWKMFASTLPPELKWQCYTADPLESVYVYFCVNLNCNFVLYGQISACKVYGEC